MKEYDHSYQVVNRAAHTYIFRYDPMFKNLSDFATVLFGKDHVLKKYSKYGVGVVYPMPPYYSSEADNSYGSYTLDALVNRKPHIPISGTDDFKDVTLEDIGQGGIVNSQFMKKMHASMYVFSQMLPDVLIIYEEITKLQKVCDDSELDAVLTGTMEEHFLPTATYRKSYIKLKRKTEDSANAIIELKKSIAVTYNTFKTLGAVK